MPGLITHYICGEAVLKALPQPCQAIITQNREIYNIGTQGPDIFFYYLPSLFRKQLNGLGSDMHTKNVGMFFSSLCESMTEENDKPTKAMIFCYISGYLTHYALDCHTHPYIYYKTGFRKKNSLAKDLKYSVYHRNFETAIDVIMLKLMSSERPSDKKLWQLIHTNSRHAHLIAEIISHSIQKAYMRKITGSQVYASLRYMVALTRILQSQKGKRKRFMELIESLTIGDNVITSIIHDQTINPSIDYLNVHKKPWYFPWDNQTEHTHSFGDLYNQSILESIQMIEALYQYMATEISLETLLRIIGNRSLASGVDCDESPDFLYSDIVFS